MHRPFRGDAAPAGGGGRLPSHVSGGCQAPAVGRHSPIPPSRREAEAPVGGAGLPRRDRSKPRVRAAGRSGRVCQAYGGDGVAGLGIGGSSWVKDGGTKKGTALSWGGSSLRWLWYRCSVWLSRGVLPCWGGVFHTETRRAQRVTEFLGFLRGKGGLGRGCGFPLSRE